jgi:hypothetical protein
MNERRERPTRTNGAQPRDSGPPAIAVAVLLGAIGLALVGGYFLVMKLIDMGRAEDCILAHRRHCGDID